MIKLPHVAMRVKAMVKITIVLEATTYHAK